MEFTRRATTVGGLGLLASSSLSTSSLADILGIGEGLEDFWLATDAYIYGYPLVTMEMTRRVITNVARPEGLWAPRVPWAKSSSFANTQMLRLGM